MGVVTELPDLVSVAEAATISDRTVQWIYSEIRAGRLEAHRVGKGYVIVRETLDGFLQERAS